MTAEERFDLLLEKYLDGALSTEEQAELRDLLAARPELRAQFVASLTQEAALRKFRPAELTASARFDLRSIHKNAEKPAEKTRPTSSRRMAVSERRRPHRFRRPGENIWMPLALAATLALVASAYLAFLRPPPTPQPVHNAPVEIACVLSVDAKGESPSLLRGGESLPLVAGMRLRPGDELATRGSNLVVQYFNEDTVVSFRPTTDASLALEDGAKRIRVVRGELSAVVAKQPTGHSLVCASPHAEATVVGTRFLLTIKTDSTRLAVTEGCVRFGRDGESLEVTAGRAALATADGQLAFVSTENTATEVAVNEKAPEPEPEKEWPRFMPGTGRPFTATSPWNGSLPERPVLDPNNDAMVERLAEKPAIALYTYAVPVYEATEQTPIRNVTCTKPWGKSPFTGLNVRVPDGATPNTGNNGSLLVIDWSSRTTWEFYQFTWEGNNIRCAWGGHVSLDGTGADSQYSGAAGGSWLGGIIRVKEIEQGRIDHALMFGSSYSKPETRYPARKPDGTFTGVGAVPVGTRVQLDPSIDVANLPGITPAELAIARAMQQHGAYCAGQTRSYSMILFAERAPDATGEANPGAIYQANGLERDKTSMPHIPWDRLRVMQQWDGK